MEHAGFERVLAIPKYSELDLDTAEAILDEADKLAKNQLGPLNAVCDREGAKFDAATGKVTLPEIFHESHKIFCENGWIGLAHSAEWGGQGMPYSLHLAANDFFFGSCLSFCLNSLLGLERLYLPLLLDHGLDFSLHFFERIDIKYFSHKFEIL
jgi:acyl-CoA dehydrogenase